MRTSDRPTFLQMNQSVKTLAKQTYHNLHQFLKVFKKQKLLRSRSSDHSDHLVAVYSGKAELINSSLASLDSHPSLLLLKNRPSVNPEPVLDSSQTLEKFEVSISDVLQVLRTVDSKKAPGFDGIPTRFDNNACRDSPMRAPHLLVCLSDYTMPPN